MNVVSNVEAVRQCLRIDPLDRLLLSLPLFHCFGQNFIMNGGLASAATSSCTDAWSWTRLSLDSDRRSDDVLWRADHVHQHAECWSQRGSIGRCAVLLSAAAALPKEVAQQWQTTIGRPIHEGYGLTETSPFAIYNHKWEPR